MDIVEFLLKDHELIRIEIVSLKKLLSHKSIQDRIEHLIEHYELHEEIEEHLLRELERLSTSAVAKELEKEFEHQHADIWDLLVKFRNSSKEQRSTSIQQTFYDFAAFIEKHMDQEERELLPTVKEYLSKEALQEMGLTAEKRHEKFFQQTA